MIITSSLLCFWSLSLQGCLGTAPRHATHRTTCVDNAACVLHTVIKSQYATHRTSRVDDATSVVNPVFKSQYATHRTTAVDGVTSVAGTGVNPPYNWCARCGYCRMNMKRLGAMKIECSGPLALTPAALIVFHTIDDSFKDQAAL